VARRQVRRHFCVAQADRFTVRDDAIRLDRFVSQAIAEGEIAFAATRERFRVGSARDELGPGELL
jgi:hypothetical protein